MKRVDEMFAIVVIDDDGDESVPAFMAPNGLMLPLMGADVERLESLLPQARLMAKQLNKPMKILKFTTREQIGEVNP